MREILFRAKGQTTGRWFEGLLIELDKDVCWIKDDRGTEWICDAETICQYTGLTDENDKKIYEGDIVAFEDMYSTESGYAEEGCVGEVGWCDEELCFYVTGRLSAESWEVLRECAVIGNIFDNADLLEGGAE